MDLELGRLPLPHPRVRRRFLDLRSVLPSEGPLRCARLEVHNDRTAPYGEVLLCPYAGLRSSLGGELNVPKPLFFCVVVVEDDTIKYGKIDLTGID